MATKGLRKISLMLASILILCSALSHQAKATHLAAADLFITYTGAGADGCSSTTEYRYLVTLDVYRACEQNSVGLPTTTSVRWGSVNAGVTNQILALNTPEIDTLDDLCDAFKQINSCRIPSNQQYPGFVRHRWTATLILPSAQTDWTFSWTSGARNGGILNGSANQSIYIEAGLNNLVKYNNSTPRFVVSPLPYICANQPATYLNGPYDPNGDSMYIQVQEPLNNATTTIPYTPAPYSLQDPIGSTPGNPFSFDNTTGTATFTPTTQGKFVMAFRCDEYERGTGTQLGYIMRDVQISVFPCTAPPPAVDSLPTQLGGGATVKINGRDAIIACPGSNIDFDISTQSQNTSSNVFLEANTNTINGSTFTTVGGGSNSVTGSFAWTPAQNQVGEHTLIITSKDSTCTGTGFSIVLKNYTVILLKIVPGLDAGPDIPICQANGDPVQLFVRGAEDIDVTWRSISGSATSSLDDPNIHNPIAVVDRTTVYEVSSSQLKGACKSRDTVSLYVDLSNEVTITPKNPVNDRDALVLCRPDYVQLEALVKGRPPKSNLACGTNGKIKLCSDPDSVTVYGSSVYGQIAYDTIDRSTPVLFSTLRTLKQEYLIRREDLDEAGLSASTLRAISFETTNNSDPTHQYANFSINIKCTDKRELSGNDGFESFGMTQVFSAANVTFEDGMHEYQFSTPYNWDSSKNLLVQICYGDNPTIISGCGVTSSPPLIKFAPTTYLSGMMLAGVDSNHRSVCGAGKDPRIEEVFSRPVFEFKFCEADPRPFDIQWTGEYLSDSTILHPLAYVPRSARYMVRTIGRSGCIMRDTLDIHVPVHNFRVTPEDTAICYGEQTPISVYGGALYKWYEYNAGTDEYLSAENSLSCIDCPEPIVAPRKTTTYRIVVSDSVFCYDTLQQRVEILPLPATHILNNDTTIKYGQSFRLLASGARTYNWNAVSSMNNSNISYPIARPTESTRYVVAGIGSNGCKAYDTLHVTVDKRDHLLVPSAFSPNGDGKNDMFKITNLTFQRVMEFRVFNRWGQEVFSTNDSRGGWDGTWRGKPQGIGNYSYLIRVAYPDGHTENYRGEVTLVR